jgi:trimeric autotransporter adhesin
MPVTVQHVHTATTPDITNSGYDILPQRDWNDTHAVTLAVSGTDIVGAFSNQGNVSFGTNAQGYITATASLSAGGAVTVSASNGSFTVGALSLGDSNGFTFYTTNGSVVGSYTVPSIAGLISSVVFSAANTSTAATALTFDNSNGVSFGLTNGSLTGSVATNYAGQGSTFSGTNISGSMTVNAAGVDLALSVAPQTVQPVAVSGSNGSFAFSTLSLGDLNGFTFYSSNGSIVGSYTVPSVAGLISDIGLSASNTSTTATGLTFSNANGVSFGLNGATVTASYTVPTQSNQTEGRYAVGNTVGQSSSSTFDARTLSIDGAGEVSVGFSAGSLLVSSPPSSVGVSTAGNTLGNTGTYSGQVILQGGNNITLSVSTAAGGAQTIVVSGANAGGAQTGISGIQVSNTTYTSGTVTFQNANGMSFGSSGANGVSASYTVPSTAGLISAIAVSGGQGNSNTVTGLTFSNANSVTFGVSTGASAATVTASIPAQSNQTVGVYAEANTTLTSSSTYDARSLSIAGEGGVIVGNSNGSVIISRGTGTTFNGANISGSLTDNSAGIQVSLSVLAQSNQSAIRGLGASNTGNTAGNTGISTGIDWVFAGSNNVTISESTTAGGPNTLWVSGPTVGGAQTGISGIQVSNTTYTSGTVTFQNANGISFGSSGANGISASYTVPTVTNSSWTVSDSVTSQTVALLAFTAANGLTMTLSTSNNGHATVVGSYTVPTQSNQSLGIYASSQTVGQSSSSTVDARSFTYVGQGIVSVGLSSGSLLISATTAAQTTQSAIKGLGASNTGNTAGNTGLSTGVDWVLAGSNNITISESTAAGGPNTLWVSGPTVGGAQTGISGIQVSNTTYTSGTVTFQNANGMSFGSSGANGISASYTVPSTAGLISAIAISGGAGNSNTVTGFTFSNSNGITFGVSTGASAATVTASYTVPAQTNQTLGGYAESNAIFTTSTTFDARSFSINAMGGVSAGFSNGSLVLSGVTTAAQSNQSLGIYASSQTVGQSSSTTIDARSFTHVGQGIVSVGLSAGSLLISATTTQTNQSLGVYAEGNTTLTTSSTYDARSLSLAGEGLVIVGNSNGSVIVSAGTGTTFAGANISGSMTLNSVGLDLSLSVAAGGGATSGGLYMEGNTTLTTSITYALSALSVYGSGIVSVGMSNGSLIIDAPSGGGGGDTGLTGYAVGNTTDNTSGTVAFPNFSINAAGGLSAGFSAGSLVLSDPPVSSLVGTGLVSVSTNGSTISVGAPIPYLSYFEPQQRAQAITFEASGSIGQTSVMYMQPFVAENYVSAYRGMFVDSHSTVGSTLEITVAVSESAQSSTGSASVAHGFTAALFSRQSTGTAAQSANLISFASTSWSRGYAMAATSTNSTNASTGNATVTTNFSISFIQNIGSNGAVTTGSSSTSGSTTTSTTTTAATTGSHSYAASAQQVLFTGVRPLNFPIAVSLSPGEYWIGLQYSSTSTEVGMLPANANIIMGIPELGVMTSSGTIMYPLGVSAATNNTTNAQQGLGSVSSSVTSTTFAIANVSNNSGIQTWFNMMCATL